MDHITLSQAVDGFLLECQARHLSSATVADYSNTFGKLKTHLGNPEIGRITADDIRAFLAGRTGVSRKTVLNYYIGLSALWTWAVAEGYAAHHIVRSVPKPKPEKIAIDPLSEDDVRRMVSALGRSKRYDRPGKRSCDNKRPSATRDRAIVYLLLDTGIRVSELCGLSISDVDLRNRRLFVTGKGSKQRMLPISASTGKMIWRYLQTERADAVTSAPLFVTRGGKRMERTMLRRLLVRIGERANVANAHPHRFRHTYAITCLRNGMNAYALQMSLGHSTMEMVRAYLQIVQADLDAAHRKASPIDNWNL